MTALELRNFFNKEFSKNGVEIPWPKYYHVDYETYANVCQFILDNTKIEDLACITTQENILWRTIAIGPHNGIMFKNIELLLKK